MWKSLVCLSRPHLYCQSFFICTEAQVFAISQTVNATSVCAMSYYYFIKIVCEQHKVLIEPYIAVVSFKCRKGFGILAKVFWPSSLLSVDLCINVCSCVLLHYIMLTKKIWFCLFFQLKLFSILGFQNKLANVNTLLRRKLFGKKYARCWGTS